MGADRPVESQRVSQAVAGDRPAMQELLLEYYEHIEAVVRSKFSPQLAAHLEVEDVIQDVLIDVHRGISSYRETEQGTFAAWLRRVTENRIIDTVRRYERLKRSGRRRRHDVRQSSTERFENIWGWLNDDSVRPDGPARRDEARQALQVCIADLKPDQREVVMAHYFEQLDTSAIADRMGKSSGAVRELLRRAREKLRSLLGSASAWLSSR